MFLDSFLVYGIRNTKRWDFRGGPVATTPSSQTWGPGFNAISHILQLKIPHVPQPGPNIVKQINKNIKKKYHEMENIRVWTKVKWEGSPVPIRLVWLGIAAPSASLSGEKDVPEHLNRDLHSWNKAWCPWPVGVYCMAIHSFSLVTWALLVFQAQFTTAGIAVAIKLSQWEQFMQKKTSICNMMSGSNKCLEEK